MSANYLRLLPEMREAAARRAVKRQRLEDAGLLGAIKDDAEGGMGVKGEAGAGVAAAVEADDGDVTTYLLRLELQDATGAPWPLLAVGC